MKKYIGTHIRLLWGQLKRQQHRQLTRQDNGI